MRPTLCLVVVVVFGAVLSLVQTRPVSPRAERSLDNALRVLEERREELEDYGDYFPDYSLDGAPPDFPLEVMKYLMESGNNDVEAVPADRGELEDLMSDDEPEDDEIEWTPEITETGDPELDEYLNMAEPGDEESVEEPEMEQIYSEVDDLETDALEEALSMMKMAKSLGYGEEDDPFVGPELDRLKLAMNAERAKVMLEDVADTDDTVEGLAEDAAQDLAVEADEMYAIYQLAQDLPLPEVETLADIIDNVADRKEQEELL